MRYGHHLGPWGCTGIDRGLWASARDCTALMFGNTEILAVLAGLRKAYTEIQTSRSTSKLLALDLGCAKLL